MHTYIFMYMHVHTYICVLNAYTLHTSIKLIIGWNSTCCIPLKFLAKKVRKAAETATNILEFYKESHKFFKNIPFHFSISLQLYKFIKQLINILKRNAW